MIRKYIVLVTWRKMKQGELAPFVLNIVVKMTDNDYFPTPAVALTDLEKAAQRYSSAVGNRLNGAMARAELKAAKAAIFALLYKQSDYVNEVSAKDTIVGDDIIIASSGFTSSKGSASKSVTPVQPKTLTAKYVNGELVITTPAIAGATGYCWVIFFGPAYPVNITSNALEIDAKAKFFIVPAGNTRECVSNIPMGVDLYVQVLAQNPAGKSAFSPTVFVHTGT